MKQSVIFRVYNKFGNVVFAEIRNYELRGRNANVSRRGRELLNRLDQYEVCMEYPERELNPGILMDENGNFTNHLP